MEATKILCNIRRRILSYRKQLSNMSMFKKIHDLHRQKYRLRSLDVLSLHVPYLMDIFFSFHDQLAQFCAPLLSSSAQSSVRRKLQQVQCHCNESETVWAILVTLCLFSWYLSTYFHILHCNFHSIFNCRDPSSAVINFRDCCN